MGIILGGTLEMMALGWMNVGLAMAPDTALASAISTLIVINTQIIDSCWIDTKSYRMK